MQEEEKVDITYPTRDWEMGDFTGKYHLARFDNKKSCLSGTQIKIEKDYESRQKAYIDNLDNFQKQHESKLASKMKIKMQSSQIQTDVYFETLFGHSLRTTEEILNEREEILDRAKKGEYPDDIKEILKCWKNVELARHHYIGYIVIHGFRSLDYQDPDTGDTMMHIACRLGHTQCVEELLKYRASADMKNKKGDYPIHEVWRIWDMQNKLLSKEDRLAQEEKTCQMILSVCSYGGFVDAQDITQQTALHIASRIGPIRAVKLLLTFHADATIRNKYGQTASDVAKAFDQTETLRLLNSWEAIKSHFVHADYHVVWHKFLSNYEANMYNANDGANKSVDKIMQELALESNSRIMEREKMVPINESSKEEAEKEKKKKQQQSSRMRMKKEAEEDTAPDTSTSSSSSPQKTATETLRYQVLVDDPLLQQAFAVTYAEGPRQYPKPWEKGWKTFVRQARALGVVDIHTRLAGGQHGTRLKVPIDQATTANLMPRLLDQKDVLSKKQHGKIERALPVPWAEANDHWQRMRTLQQEQQEKLKADLQRRKEEESEDDEEDDENEREKGKEGGTRGVDQTLSSENKKNEVIDHYANVEQHIFDVGKVKDDMIPKFKQFFAPNSIAARRKATACQVALDGKFSTFTTRFATQSVLGLPIRAPQAPMMGTEEEGSEMRGILSQGVEYDRLEKYKQRDKLEEQYGIIKPPKKSSIGAYCEGVEMARYSERDRLFDQVKKKTDSKVVESVVDMKNNKLETTTSIAKLAQFEKQPKIDLVASELRPRYVQADLLPYQQELSTIQQLINSEKSKEEERLKKQLKLSSDQDVTAARAGVEASIANSQSMLTKLSKASDETENAAASATLLKGSLPPASHKERLESERQQAIQKLLFSKNTVKYGTGRITSSHNTTGKIEEPWTTVTGKYQTAPGDRTV